MQQIGIPVIPNKMRLPRSLDRRWKRAEAAFSSLWDGRWPRRTAPAAQPVARDGPVPAADAPLGLGLALQGGGAHGAFTWGVLDRLFEADRFRIDAISGASAGALNAVVAASGLLASGPEGARASLDGFWRTVSAKAALTPYSPSPLNKMLSGWNQDGTGRQIGLDIASRLVSPYQFNPLGHNPLREILAAHVDFERLRRNRRIKLFVAATEIRTGRAKIFKTGQLTPDVLLATAALPSVHHAVEIDGAHYWDGGFSANPPLIPLADKAGVGDILLVQIEPPHEEELPVTAGAIRSRLAQLTFMAPLNRELEALRWIERRSPAAADRGASPLPAPRLHRIDSGAALKSLGQFSKMNPELGMLLHVKDLGRDKADRWLSRKARAVGERSTLRF